MQYQVPLGLCHPQDEALKLPSGQTQEFSGVCENETGGQAREVSGFPSTQNT